MLILDANVKEACASGWKITTLSILVEYRECKYLELLWPMIPRKR